MLSENFGFVSPKLTKQLVEVVSKAIEMSASGNGRTLVRPKRSEGGYDPTLARFLSPDIFVQNIYNSQGYNSYSYVNNNPLMFTDPSGWQIRGDTKPPPAPRLPKDDPYENTLPGQWLSSGWISGTSGLYSGNYNYQSNNYVESGPTGEDYDAYDDFKNEYTFSNLTFSEWYNLGGSAGVNSFVITDWYNGEVTGDSYMYSTIKFTSDDANSDQNDGVTDLNGSEVLKGIGVGATYVSSAFGLAQIGMLEYRSSLPIHSKVGTFSKFSATYKGLGIASKTLGRTGTYVGAPVSIGLDYSAYRDGDISLGRFGYRTGGLGVSVGTGAAIGGPLGAVAGVLVGGAAVAGEYIYDSFLIPVWQETQRGIYNFENAIRNGWYPSR